MTEKERSAIAAAVILIGFGLLAYFLPTIMIAIRAGLLRHLLDPRADPERQVSYPLRLAPSSSRPSISTKNAPQSSMPWCTKLPHDLPLARATARFFA
jgi:hypothetical protein